MAIKGLKEPRRCENCGNWIVPDAQGIAEHDCPLVCKNCGHQPCPFCLSWCDVLSYEGESGEMWMEECCDGECEYENFEILWCNDRWRQIYAEAEKKKAGHALSLQSPRHPVRCCIP